MNVIFTFLMSIEADVCYFSLKNSRICLRAHFLCILTLETHEEQPGVWFGARVRERECRATNSPVLYESSSVWRLPDSQNSLNYDLV